MDRTKVSGTFDAGSIPAGAAPLNPPNRRVYNLYSLELEEINQLGGTLDRLNHLLKDEPSTIPLRAAEDILADFEAKVKEYFGEEALIAMREPSTFSLRTKPAPKKTGIGYKVFYRGKDGKLYPPMVANPGGKDTPSAHITANAKPSPSPHPSSSPTN